MLANGTPPPLTDGEGSDLLEWLTADRHDPFLPLPSPLPSLDGTVSWCDWEPVELDPNCNGKHRSSTDGDGNGNGSSREVFDGYYGDRDDDGDSDGNGEKVAGIDGSGRNGRKRPNNACSNDQSKRACNGNGKDDFVGERNGSLSPQTGESSEAEITPALAPVTTEAKPKGCGNGKNNGKESRWAEQLLNPCASAIEARNNARVHHLLFVLRDLASLSGDPNHRLAAHGLRALARRLEQQPSLPGPTGFANSEPRALHRALLKFHELSPWFSFSHTVCNQALIQALGSSPQGQGSSPVDMGSTLHILDIGVSHGIQWPTFIEAMARKAPTMSLRLTVVTGLIVPFASGPNGDDFPVRLTRFATSFNMKLDIKVVRKALENLTVEDLGIFPGERLAICVQSRLHEISENNGDRRKFLGFLKGLGAEAMFLSEIDGGETGLPDKGIGFKAKETGFRANEIGFDSNETGYAAKETGPGANGFASQESGFGGKEGGFTRWFSEGVEFLWRFLDSCGVGFKGRECEERRLIEEEVAEMCFSAEREWWGKRKWGDEMRNLGFIGGVLGEEMVEAGRVFLKKYDSGWEMRGDEGCLSLFWKGQPVSFCSLWLVPKR
ncbi:nodulation-signaling pathway 1 protein [Amborella trichopoda]|uniref:Uncharacterized protein n=1 Tax=Amborella trichopoda TaxID=13333 RepID=W1PT99_AMBTC|nr:nodulation-signaling pathway 1 protein [Amborella trichopoda]ERN11263.1 hypothetical protein AMTR_s00024p00236340 [Amborella trichopoda]|eukprot:XP_006849682.1 nodulation-signaling pathway 1 protein [Amborella trichopoda]